MKITSIPYLWIIALLVAASSQSYARSNVHVTGIVVDSTDTPLPYVDIVLRHSDLKLTTDVHGQFDLTLKRRSHLTFIWPLMKPYKLRVRNPKHYTLVLYPNTDNNP